MSDELRPGDARVGRELKMWTHQLTINKVVNKAIRDGFRVLFDDKGGLRVVDTPSQDTSALRGQEAPSSAREGMEHDSDSPLPPPVPTGAVCATWCGMPRKMPSDCEATESYMCIPKHNATHVFCSRNCLRASKPLNPQQSTGSDE